MATDYKKIVDDLLKKMRNVTDTLDQLDFTLRKSRITSMQLAEDMDKLKNSETINECLSAHWLIGIMQEELEELYTKADIVIDYEIQANNLLKTAKETGDKIHSIIRNTDSAPQSGLVQQ